jgi:D-3-phosphoglycerate dehydrogenase
VTERFRVLVSCPRAWSQLDGFAGLFAEKGIVVDIPDVVNQQLDEEELLAVIAEYDGILAGDDELTRRVIEAAPRLKVISKWGVGVDAIDLDAAAEHGVLVENTPGMFGDELADYALGFLLLLARRQHVVDREVRSGNWTALRGHSLAGLTIGIVGLGSSGSALATRAAALRLEVVGTDPLGSADEPGVVRRVGFHQLLAMSDIISLHLPAQPDGGPVIGDAAIGMAKTGFWLINTSRGSLVDETALLAGLRSGQVGAAALDVFEREPIEPDHPLLQHPAVIVGSHNGSNTHEAVERTTKAAVENLVNGLSGDT